MRCVNSFTYPLPKLMFPFVVWDHLLFVSPMDLWNSSNYSATRADAVVDS